MLHEGARGAPRQQSSPDASVQLDSTAPVQRWADPPPLLRLRKNLTSCPGLVAQYKDIKV